MTAVLQTCLAFLKKCPSPKKAALLKHLSSDEQHRLQALSPTFQDLSQGTVPLDAFLDKLHFSHLISFFRSLPEAEIRFFLSALIPIQAAKLKEQLLFSASLPELTSLARIFLRQKILESLLDDEEALLSIEALPESPLNYLLLLSSAELLRLIDFLGLHDLALETKQIIETARLKKIQSALLPEEQAYLKHLSHQKESLGFKKMGLEKWDGQAQTLKVLLRQRGINRLAKAAYGHDQSFLWYLTHLLDVEHVLQLQKWMTPLEPAKASFLLGQQIFNVLSLLYPEAVK